MFVAVLEDEPLVVTNSALQVDNADSVSGLIQQLKSTLHRRYQTQSIMIQKEQADSIIGLMQRAKPEFAGTVELQTFKITLLATYTLPSNPIGEYLNLQVSLLPAKGLNIEHVILGGVELPGDWVLSLLTGLVDWHTSSSIASQFVDQIERIHVFHSTMVVTFQPIDKFLDQLNELKNGLSMDQDQPMKVRTAYYLKYVSQLPVAQLKTFPSLAAYMSPLFTEVSRRSAQSDPVKENEAAILALAIYAGHHRVANLVGEVQPVQGEVTLPKYRPLLANRIDLTQHFLVSAALKVLSQQGISSAIGEFKELMDRGANGSGYSFVDLAADIAGVKFAIMASDPKNARKLQKILINTDSESVFFPDITGLPEGMSKAVFKQSYGEVDSPAYLSQVAEIENKINQLRIFESSD